MSRRETTVASVCALSGLVAILVARGGIESMIAGSVGSVAAGCIAVGLTFLDGRLSYGQRVQANVPIILMLAAAGVGVRAHALTLAGYPLLLLGLVGLAPSAMRWLKAGSAAESAPEKPMPDHSASSALSNPRVRITSAGCLPATGSLQP